MTRCSEAGPVNACKTQSVRPDCNYAGTNMLFKMSHYELMLHCQSPVCFCPSVLDSLQRYGWYWGHGLWYQRQSDWGWALLNFRLMLLTGERGDKTTWPLHHCTVFLIKKSLISDFRESFLFIYFTFAKIVFIFYHFVYFHGGFCSFLAGYCHTSGSKYRFLLIFQF